MYSHEKKMLIASAVQQILQIRKDDELPEGEINFLLHVDGEGPWSWANITNNNGNSNQIPIELIRNMTVK
jgi:hypothetical protein